ncbi:MAG TPA: DNA polymerase/3'-5' exonuclease PolX [Methylomirabilota bacterium]|jgi:DNA polymerase (family 10)|nr:DNA polymerase/3'-5' exonuclease PolX [Methylomirabilota bacterium]
MEFSVRNFEVAECFHEIADLLEIREENVFRIRAYRRAAQQLENLAEDVVEALAAGKKIPGIGADLAAKIHEYAERGAIAYLDELRIGLPRGVRQLMGLSGVGPKTARLLFERLGIDSIERLEEACRSGRILETPGIRQKTCENILRGIETWRLGQARLPLAKALPLADALVRALRASSAVDAIEVAGSLRRRVETVGDIDILVTSNRPAAVLDRFVDLPAVAAVLARGETKASIRHRENLQVDLRVVEPDAFGAALQYFTGSKNHNVKLRELAVRKKLKISEYGVFDERGRRVAGRTEEEVYGAVGLPWIPPELREDGGEIEAAAAGRLPPLIEPGHIRGDLHAHTEWSDGHHPLEALVAAAEARGYEYIIVSDHSRSATIARGLSPEQVRDQIGKIRALQANHRIRILTGSECDILADGTLDFPDDLLAELDVVLAAVHSRFKQERTEMTARICRALENPHVRILVHPTGRLLGSRDPYDVDLEQVFATAKRHGKAVEINSSPWRLDLKDVHARRARDLGLMLSIDTDTHYLSELDNIALGIATARRAWVGPDQVVNAMPLDRLLAWSRQGR